MKAYPKDNIKVYCLLGFKPDPESEYGQLIPDLIDMTDGILSISTNQGYDNWEGPFDTPDAGVMTIVSRNENFDPQVNSNIKYNARIFVTYGDFQEDPSSPMIWSGWLTDINVEYRREDHPLITFSVIDVVGLLQKTFVTQDIQDYFYDELGAPANLQEFISYYFYNPYTEENFTYKYWLNFDIINDEVDPGADGTPLWWEDNARYIPKAGESVWDILCKYAQSNLMTIKTYVDQWETKLQFIPYFGNSEWYFNNGLDPRLNLVNYSGNFPEADLDSQLGGTYSFPWEDNNYGYKQQSDRDVFSDLGDIANYSSDTTKITYGQSYVVDPTTGTGNWINEEIPSSGYKSVIISDGMDRLVNQIQITNTVRTYNGVGDIVETTETFSPEIVANSIEEFGPSALTLSTIYPQDRIDAGQVYQTSQRIFKFSSQSEFDITELILDGTVNDIWPFIYDYSNQSGAVYPITIYHKINETLEIHRMYEIIGMRHEITESDWRISLTLKKTDYQKYVELTDGLPTITMNTTSGDTSTSFTATLNYSTPEYDMSDISVILWNLNYRYPYSTMPFMEATGIDGVYTPPAFHVGSPSYTWTYDDDGVLAPWGVAPWNIRYGYGPGTYVVTAYAFSSSRICWLTANAVINVVAAEAYADFNIEKDFITGAVTVIDASGADTDTWDWDMGDGTTYTGKNPPKHFYQETGTYDITLEVSNGITTDTITKSVSVLVQKINIQWLKFEWKGTYTTTGGVPNKRWLEKILKIEPLLPSGPIEHRNIEIEATVGNVYNQNGTTIWAPLDNSWPAPDYPLNKGTQIITNRRTINYTNTSFIWIKPTRTSGTDANGTFEYDVSLIMKYQPGYDPYIKYLPVGQPPVSTPFPQGGEWYTDNRSPQLNLIDILLIPQDWQANYNYELINVYASNDKSVWHKIGDWDFQTTRTRSSLINAGQYLGWTLDNIVNEMPPLLPQP